MAVRKTCVKISCANLVQYSRHGVCAWHYKELMGTYSQRKQRNNPQIKPAGNLTEWEWIKEYLKL
jgi:hypothetical protein